MRRTGSRVGTCCCAKARRTMPCCAWNAEGSAEMFIGHYAMALAAKRAAPRTSLGTLFAATSLADLLWPVFLLFGWEQAHVVPGPNPFLTLWLDSIPISHSLITLIGWGALF